MTSHPIPSKQPAPSTISAKPLKLKRPKGMWPTTTERLIRAKPKKSKGGYKLQAPRRSIF